MHKYVTLTVLFFLSTVFISLGQVSPPQVIHPLNYDTSIPLRDMEEAPLSQTPWVDGIIQVQDRDIIIDDSYVKDYSVQEFNGVDDIATIGANFDGVPAQGFAPPDMSGDVGPNHYMQMVNVRFQIWDKSGNSLLGPSSLGTLWSGFPGPWASSLNDGDPIVLYDETSDRWFAAQFSLPNFPSGPFYVLVAVSQTGDPTGAWHRYGFETTHMPDYPKFGVWADGYYMSANVFSSGSLNFIGTYAVAFERDQMLLGNSANMVLFLNSAATTWSLLPSDWDGPTAPPTAAPNYFTQIHGGNGLDVYEFNVDWTNPGSSTFTGPSFLSTTSYSGVNGIPQLGSGTLLDDMDQMTMNRLNYRNFGTHQSMVVCHTINAGGSRAGMRWYELRNTGTGWSVYQEGTYAPADGLERWMGSIAINENGDIALGYSVSSSSIFPEIRFTGRHEGDPLGTMTATEETIHAGSGSQSGLSRWGDYTQMVSDPDGQTFWYTNQYQPFTGSFNWRTRIASFTFGPPCPVGLAVNPNPADGSIDVDINAGQVTWDNDPLATSIEVFFGEFGSMVSVYSGPPVTSYSFGTLNYSTTYQWRVDGSDGSCTTSGTLWSFSTMPDPNIFCAFMDDFEDGGLTNWLVTNDGGTCVWEALDVGANGYTLPPDATGFLLSADSDLCGSGTTLLSTATMVTPVDLAVYQTVWLEWDNDWRTISGSDEAHVEVSIDGGSTWMSVLSWVGSDMRNSHENIDISSIAALEASILVRFRTLQPGWDWWWAVDNFAIYAMDIVPVELSSFAAAVNKDEVQLNWTTATETNNQGFEVQRKTADEEYQKIGFVAGHGTTTDIQNYSYADSKVDAGSYSYRLKQIDYNGSYEYSSEVAVDVTLPLEFTLEQNYPNPFNPSTSIVYSIPENGFVTLDVYNLLGEKVASLVNGVQEAGRYEINFDASSLSSGIYVYSLKSGSFSAIRKMILMK